MKSSLSHTAKCLTILLLASCFISSKCNKEEALGEYYFRCKIDGEIYRPNSCANCTQCDLLGDTTFILGANRDFETLGIGIKDKNSIQIGNYALSHVIGRRGDYKNSTLTDDRYFTDSLRTGQLVIELIDKQNKIISGTFQFRAYNIIRNDSVNVSDGKFRLQYSTY